MRPFLPSCLSSRTSCTSPNLLLNKRAAAATARAAAAWGRLTHPSRALSSAPDHRYRAADVVHVACYGKVVEEGQVSAAVSREPSPQQDPGLGLPVPQLCMATIRDSVRKQPDPGSQSGREVWLRMQLEGSDEMAEVKWEWRGSTSVKDITRLYLGAVLPLQRPRGTPNATWSLAWGLMLDLTADMEAELVASVQRDFILWASSQSHDLHLPQPSSSMLLPQELRQYHDVVQQLFRRWYGCQLLTKLLGDQPASSSRPPSAAGPPPCLFLRPGMLVQGRVLRLTGLKSDMALISISSHNTVRVGFLHISSLSSSFLTTEQFRAALPIGAEVTAQVKKLEATSLVPGALPKVYLSCKGLESPGSAKANEDLAAFNAEARRVYSEGCAQRLEEEIGRAEELLAHVDDEEEELGPEQGPGRGGSVLQADVGALVRCVVTGHQSYCANLRLDEAEAGAPAVTLKLRNAQMSMSRVTSELALKLLPVGTQLAVVIRHNGKCLSLKDGCWEEKEGEFLEAPQRVCARSLEAWATPGALRVQWRKGAQAGDYVLMKRKASARANRANVIKEAREQLKASLKAANGVSVTDMLGAAYPPVLLRRYVKVVEQLEAVVRSEAGALPWEGELVALVAQVQDEMEAAAAAERYLPFLQSEPMEHSSWLGLAPELGLSSEELELYGRVRGRWRQLEADHGVWAVELLGLRLKAAAVRVLLDGGGEDGGGEGTGPMRPEGAAAADGAAMAALSTGTAREASGWWIFSSEAGAFLLRVSEAWSDAQLLLQPGVRYSQGLGDEPSEPGSSSPPARRLQAQWMRCAGPVLCAWATQADAAWCSFFAQRLLPGLQGSGWLPELHLEQPAAWRDLMASLFWGLAQTPLPQTSVDVTYGTSTLFQSKFLPAWHTETSLKAAEAREKPNYALEQTLGLLQLAATACYRPSCEVWFWLLHDLQRRAPQCFEHDVQLQQQRSRAQRQSQALRRAASCVALEDQELILNPDRDLT